MEETSVMAIRHPIVAPHNHDRMPIPHSCKSCSAARETAADWVIPNEALDLSRVGGMWNREAKQQQFGTRRPNSQDKQRGRARYPAKRERLSQERTAQQTFVDQLGGCHERVQDRDRHAQEQACTKQHDRT